MMWHWLSLRVDDYWYVCYLVVNSLPVDGMDPLLFGSPEDYLSFAAYKPLPFEAGAVTDLGRVIPPYKRLRLLCWSCFATLQTPH